MKRPSASTPKSQAGFTLIEVLVVVIIAAVLAGIAAPSWFSFLNRQRVGSVRSDLVQNLRSAQQIAIQRRQTVELRFEDVDDRPTMFIGGAARPLGGEDATGNVEIRSFYVAPDGTQTDRPSIRFDHQGNPVRVGNEDPIVPFVISVSNPQSSTQQCAIIVNLLGSVKTADNEDCDDPDLGL